MSERKPARKGTTQENPPRVRRGARLDLLPKNGQAKQYISCRLDDALTTSLPDALALASSRGIVSASEWLRGVLAQGVREEFSRAGRAIPALPSLP